MTRQQTIDLQAALKAVENLTGAKFCYAITKNIAMIQSEVQTLKTIVKYSEKFTEYDGKRAELAKSMAKKDEKGEPTVQVVNGQATYVLIDQKEFDKKLEVLKSQYKEAITEQEAKFKDLQKLLEEESDLKFHTIDQKDIPGNITAGQLSGIIKLIKE